MPSSIYYSRTASLSCQWKNVLKPIKSLEKTCYNMEKFFCENKIVQQEEISLAYTAQIPHI